MVPKTLIVVVILVLAGCVSTPAPIEDPRAVWCAENEPQRPSIEEIAAMSIERKREIAVHNRKGADWCGWKP